MYGTPTAIAYIIPSSKSQCVLTVPPLIAERQVSPCMAGGRSLPRMQLLLSAAVLVLVAVWLPGGLLPTRRRVAMPLAHPATAPSPERGESGTAGEPSAEFRIDAAGRLLLPNCGGRKTIGAVRTLLRVQCAGSGRATAAGGSFADNWRRGDACRRSCVGTKRRERWQAYETRVWGGGGGDGCCEMPAYCCACCKGVCAAHV